MVELNGCGQADASLAGLAGSGGVMLGLLSMHTLDHAQARIWFAAEATDMMRIRSTGGASTGGDRSDPLSGYPWFRSRRGGSTEDFVVGARRFVLWYKRWNLECSSYRG